MLMEKNMVVPTTNRIVPTGVCFFSHRAPAPSVRASAQVLSLALGTTRCCWGIATILSWDIMNLIHKYIITLLRVIPTMAFNSSHLTFYLAYLLTFYLTFYLAYLLAFYLSYLLTFYLAYLLTFCLAYLSGIQSGMSSDILSGILI